MELLLAHAQGLVYTLLNVMPSTDQRDSLQALILILQHLCAQNITSLGDAVVALARLIGSALTKKQPFPGGKVLATAIERFFFIKLGFDASTKPLQD
jgi:hypothetical protein